MRLAARSADRDTSVRGGNMASNHLRDAGIAVAQGASVP